MTRTSSGLPPHEQPVPLANAGELLETMTVRLEMQRRGITNPPAAVKKATELLVAKLAAIDPSEGIETSSAPGILARYVRARTGEVLAEIPDPEV